MSERQLALSLSSRTQSDPRRITFTQSPRNFNRVRFAIVVVGVARCSRFWLHLLLLSLFVYVNSIVLAIYLGLRKTKPYCSIGNKFASIYREIGSVRRHSRVKELGTLKHVVACVVVVVVACGAERFSVCVCEALISI